MTPALWFLLALAIVLTVIAVVAILTAPVGYEDETGFHLGTPPGEDR